MERLGFFERKAAVAALMFGAGAAALTGCSTSPEVLPDRPATVVGHEYHPAHTILMMVGKVLIPVRHAEEFHLDVKQCDRTADDTEDGVKDGCITEHKSVTRQAYQDFPDGSTITFSKEDD